MTLGGTGFATGKRHPTVEDKVTVGSGAKLLGPITVGRGAKVGANSVVVIDVPADATVVGNPGHVVRVEGRRVEGPDADWVHLPDPVADAIRGLASRIEAVEHAVAEMADEAGTSRRRRRRTCGRCGRAAGPTPPAGRATRPAAPAVRSPAGRPRGRVRARGGA